MATCNSRGNNDATGGAILVAAPGETSFGTRRWATAIVFGGACLMYSRHPALQKRDCSGNYRTVPSSVPARVRALLASNSEKSDVGGAWSWNVMTLLNTIERNSRASPVSAHRGRAGNRLVDPRTLLMCRASAARPPGTGEASQMNAERRDCKLIPWRVEEGDFFSSLRPS